MQSHPHHPHYSPQQPQQHNQLAVLLSAAAAGDPSTAAGDGETSREADRVSALESLRLAILYPPNAPLVSHSAPFLAQGLFQLLSDQCYAVRLAASVAYGSLCSILCSTTTSLNQNKRQTSSVSGGLVDVFIGWALPLIQDVTVRDSLAELALEGLREFLCNGEATGVDRYALSILKSCQELLEDERTSLNLLHQLLGLLSLISGKYWHCFQPHFVDIVDLLLGWALMPDLPESDRSVIMETFLQFNGHWTSNLQVSLTLLLKFLGDMEVLTQEKGLGLSEENERLLALLSCFSTVLQASAMALSEIHMLEQISEALESMVPRLLACLLLVAQKSSWEKWTTASWKCLILLAELFQEKFSGYYSSVVDILIQSLKMLPTTQLPGLLRANFQLLSLQKCELHQDCVKKLLHFDSPFSLLRFHPNHIVARLLAGTYLFFLQHGSDVVMSQAITSIMEELEVLSITLNKYSDKGGHARTQTGDWELGHSQLNSNSLDRCSLAEVSSLIKFDLKLLLCHLSDSSGGSFISISSASGCCERSRLLISFVQEKLNPFAFPVEDFLELQLHVICTLRKLCEVELLCKIAICKNNHKEAFNSDAKFERSLSANSLLSTASSMCLKEYEFFVVRCLGSSSPLAIKEEALEWMGSLCDVVLKAIKMLNLGDSTSGKDRFNISDSLLSAVLASASDREVKVRSGVAHVLGQLLHTNTIHPSNFYFVAEVALERLGDLDSSVKHAFSKVLTNVLPAAFLAHGIFMDWTFYNRGPMGSGTNINWKQILALKEFPRQLQSQQLVTILSYISQRWKAPLSSWIHRLVSCFTVSKDTLPTQQEEENHDFRSLFLGEKTDQTLPERMCPGNSLAAIWWSIHEAARYSVSLRLRTNLGGPTQTFAALERMLLDVSQMLLLENENTDGGLTIGSSRLHLLPMRLLLDFVESLKKYVYNAYEGSSLLPFPTRQSSSFFLANKKVCEEWFSRISDPMLNAGLSLQCHDAVLCYSSLRLQDLQNAMASLKEKISVVSVSENTQNFRKKIASDTMKMLRHSALALCRMHEPEDLVGLHNWALHTFSSLFMEENHTDWGRDETLGYFSWIKGLVYQAHGQYEKAAVHFSHLLQSEEVLSFMGSEGIQFVIARVIESYTAISDWKSLESWLAELQALRAKHAGRAYSGALTAAGNEINAIHALACFDEGNLQAAWAYLDLTPKSSNELTLDPKLALERSEQMLLRAMLQQDGQLDEVTEKVEKAELMLDEVLSIAPLEGLAVVAPYVLQLHCLFAFTEGLKLDGQDKDLQFSPMLSSVHSILDSPICKVHQDCSLLLKVFRVYRTVLPTAPVTLFLCQKLATLARKQSNFVLAERMRRLLMDNITKSSQMGIFEEFSSNMQYENILLNYAVGNHEDAFTGMWSLLRKCILSSDTLPSECYTMMCANACLKLSTWLKRDYCSINVDNVITKIYSELIQSDLFSINMWISDNDELSSVSNRTAFLEELSGICIKSSCRLCPTMGKAWHAYASWCYRHAKNSFSLDDTFPKSCFSSPILLSEFPPDRFQLNEEERSSVATIIMNYFLNGSSMATAKAWGGDDMDILLPEDRTLVNSVIQKAIDLIEAAAGAPGVEDCVTKCPSSVLASQLCSLFLHADSKTMIDDNSKYVDQLVNIWFLLRRRRISLFGHAAYGFLQYLSCPSSKLLHPSGIHDFSHDKSGSCTLRAALYVLNVILNYGLELKEMIEPGLASVPMLPWQEITPQLFARLVSHPQKEVRRLLEGLLMMLAKLSPWSIVYPTLVDAKNIEGDLPEELQRLLDCLGKLYPQLINETQLLINELVNITVLWEEQWLSTLQDLHSDVLRRINMLQEESRRISENATLSQSEKNKINAAKYSAVMSPIIVALERRFQCTSRGPQTPHEEWFQEEYGEQLKSAITKFKIPPLSPLALGDAWRPFVAIASSLLNYQRKSVVTMSEVAPRLARISASEVPMPGLEKQISSTDLIGSSGQIQDLVTISSFSEKVTILATKTKPKKISIRGSDGQNYVFLLKGREDLRLDARIMQLLQAVNSFLYSCTETRSRSLAVRYYSVTPISGRAGLIQWVDNVISIYSVFKSWQQRAQFAHISSNSGGNLDRMIPTVPRPSDMFYGKILPALKEKGIKRVISRKDWPHEVKRKVLLELMREVPRELIRREIWCASEGFGAYSSKSKRFSNSVAVMSIVGHILGLGDRHLDNILMDFFSGDIIHIDYNVCFDKGRRLKIPEIVPFRLTQTIEAALGLTGKEGTFKANSEAVLGVLRKNKDVLLMMLDVFVWDPLIEWTRGNVDDEAAIGGEEKKGMELAVSLSLFASRFHEIRVPLQDHHDLLLTTLPTAESVLENFFNVLNQYEIISAIFYHAEHDRSNLAQHETSTKSVVAEATTISEKAWTSYEMHSREFTQAKVTATEKAQEAAKWVEQHGRVLDSLRGGSVPTVHALINAGGSEEILSLTSAVIAAGVPLTVVPEPTQAQCYELDKEVSGLVLQLSNGLSVAVGALQQYSLALQRILPLNYITTSPVSGWSQILQLSTANLSSEFFSLARRQAAELITNVQGDANDSVLERHRELLIDMGKFSTQLEKVKDEYLELANSIGTDTEKIAKEQLLTAFMNFLYSANYLRKEDGGSYSYVGQSKNDAKKDRKFHFDLEEKKLDVLAIIHIAASALFQDVKTKVLDISRNFLGVGINLEYETLRPYLGTFVHGFEEQIEKSSLIAGLVNELQQIVGLTQDDSLGMKDATYYSEQNWVSVFQDSLHSCNLFIEQITEAVLPEVVKLAVSCHAEVMEAFGIISQIRGSTDSALEQLIEIEHERASLADLEKNYFSKVDVVTKQQLALEEAARQGRENLSWEEAEELATQEEACRAQLDKLHQTWNQREMINSSLQKREASIRLSLAASERQFSSLMSNDHGDNSHAKGIKVLLSVLTIPFSEFERIDQRLPPCGAYLDLMTVLSEFRSFGSLSESTWKIAGILKNHSFFIWKISVIDSILDLCIHDMSSFLDHSLGFDQLYNLLKKKLEIRLQDFIGQYMKDRVASAFFLCLENENEKLKLILETKIEFMNDQVQKGSVSATRIQRMFEDFCNAHEIARAARSTARLLKRQKIELTESLHKTVLEIVQIEWLYTHTLPRLSRKRLVPQDIIGDDVLYPAILGLDRSELLEKLQTSVSSVAKSLEHLQRSERTSVSAETQLERAMGWACAGSTSSNSMMKSSGIPPEFHNHILKRKQLLRNVHEQASNLMNICTSILEFEASRDGLYRVLGEIPYGHPGDRQLWQQVYMNALTRLDTTYHSFKIAEQEWRLAQKNMEAAANSSFSASKELSIASLKAKSAADDFQDILRVMKDSACEVNVALSSFISVSRGQTALTSECGTMLDEVLAIADGLHDINKSAKEATVVHRSLMANLNKVASIIFPLEMSLSTDLAAFMEADAREKDNNISIPAVHGQILYNSYLNRVRETCHSLRPLVSSVTSSVTELHGMLIKLAKTAGLHAKNLHKALEGFGETQALRSPGLALSSDMLNTSTLYGEKLEHEVSDTMVDDLQDVDLNKISLQENGWISPPDTIYGSSLDSSGTSSEAGLSETSDKIEQYSNTLNSRDSAESCSSFLLNDSADKLELMSTKILNNGTNFSPEASPDVTEQKGALSVQNDASMASYDMAYLFDTDIATTKNPKSSENKDDGSIVYQENKGLNFSQECSSNFIRGKNAYAMSVIRQVEKKLDGRDIDENRSASVSEQVEYLIKQATSIDNLCNMYEGWTPWI